MKHLAAAMTMIVSLCISSNVLAKDAGCLIIVNNVKYLDKKCKISIPDKDGSFTIGVGQKNREKYFAYINVDAGKPHGYWNATPDSNHADSSLGLLKRTDSCWENEIAKLCAYK